MVGIQFKKLQRILCLGAHSDDIEIGCGGTILKLIEQNPTLEFLWVVFSADGSRADEARSSAEAFLEAAAKKSVSIKQYKTSFFPFQGEAIKESFEEIKAVFQPDLVFTHYRDDRHQDHRILSDLAWNTFRNHVILEYEIPKYDGDLGMPNVFVELGEDHCRKKLGYLLKFFQTQSNKHWFDQDTFLALMRLRGMEAASVTRYAEAFYSRKMVFG